MTFNRVGLVAGVALCSSVAFTPAALAQVPVAAAPAAATAASAKVVVTASILNVRKGPSTAAGRVAKAYRGQRLTVLNRSGVWLKVGTSRWVHGAYVTPVTAPASSSRVSATTFAPGTTVSSRTSQQVMVADRTSGTKGTWARYEFRSGAWHRVDARTTAAFGEGGMKPASRRVAGDHSTPIGTFGLPYAFGAGSPGTKLGYKQVTRCSWWIADRTQSDYNRFRESCSTPASVKQRSEDLHYYTFRSSQRQYRQGVVIDFNYTNPKRSGYGSGAGIFLHYSGSGRTLGCVGLMNSTELTNTVKWLNPAKNPRIVIKG